jgi:hypothetical protein
MIKDVLKWLLLVVCVVGMTYAWVSSIAERAKTEARCK